MRLPPCVAAMAWTLLLCVAMAGNVQAHAGHETISEVEAVTKAMELVELLVRREKIPPTWKECTLEAAQLKLIDDIDEWHLVFLNAAEADPQRNRLYMFLSYDGQVLAVNFSGKAN